VCGRVNVAGLAESAWAVNVGGARGECLGGLCVGAGLSWRRVRGRIALQF
jgi:hypothetical protein